MVNINRCEMCGREVTNLIEIEIEGAQLYVCPSCSTHGKKVVKKRERGRKPNRRRIASQKQTNKASQKSKRPYYTKKKEDNIVLAEDYNERLYKARQKMNLTQKDVANKTGISASNIQSFELGKLRPTDKQMKTLEKFYNIKLTEKIIDFGMDDKKSSKGYQTLGDIVVIKKKNDE